MLYKMLSYSLIYLVTGLSALAYDGPDCEQFAKNVLKGPVEFLGSVSNYKWPRSPDRNILTFYRKVPIRENNRSKFRIFYLDIKVFNRGGIGDPSVCKILDPIRTVDLELPQD